MGAILVNMHALGPDQIKVFFKTIEDLPQIIYHCSFLIVLLFLHVEYLPAHQVSLQVAGKGPGQTRLALQEDIDLSKVEESKPRSQIT